MASQLRLYPKAAPARKRAAAPRDPFAQQTPAEIAQIVNQYRSQLPAPLSMGQIRTQAQGMVDPVIARITQAVQQRAAGQAQAVEGYTNRLAQSLGGLGATMGAPYQQAQAATATSNQALADRLSGAGQQGGQDLAARLASINAPGAVDPAVAAVQNAGTGAGNSLYASGNAALQQLIANAASAKSYGQKLPGVAQLGGIQQAGLVRQQAAGDLASGITQAESQLPTIVGNLRSMSDQRAQNRASLGADLYKTLTGQNVGRATASESIRQFNASQAGDQSAAAYNAQQDSIQNQQAQQRIGVSQQRANTVAPKSVAPGNTLVDPSTGKAIYTAPPKPAKPAKEFPNLTKGQVLHLRAGIAAAFNGVPEKKDANDKVIAAALPPVDYQTAISHAISAGYSRAGATKMANRFYMPGARGRPKR